jgi:uncharacterized membrane protein
MRKWYPWSVVTAALAFSLAMYSRLPERIPIHWDMRGVADGWAGRMMGAFLLPGILAIVALILPRLPAIDPKRANYEKFRPTYDLVVNAVVTMLGVLHVAGLGVALGWPISMERLTPVMMGALFIVIGNVMPRARPNWLFGIRTPWTLTNDRVWERTHRLGGHLFVIGGVVVMLVALAPAPLVGPIMIGIVTVVAGTPLAYSYFTWRRETSR